MAADLEPALEPLGEAQREIADLKGELEAQKKINAVLIRRVQRSIDSAGTSFSMFETNILLQNKVEERATELKSAYDELKNSQEKLLQSEKMASLGHLVAGVAHEINTTIGIGVTTSTHLSKLTEEITDAFNKGTMTKSALKTYMDDAAQSCVLLYTNLERAASLIRSFKKVYSDQASHDKRKFLLAPYLHDIVFSLQPVIKKTKHKVEIHCPQDVEMHSYPGALGQVVTNFIINSITHAYDDGLEGRLTVRARHDGRHVTIAYSDDGKGVPNENIKKIFDPFFTTKRGSGGTGLGLHIVYNTVTETLKGTIRCDSVYGKGTLFTVVIPVEA